MICEGIIGWLAKVGNLRVCAYTATLRELTTALTRARPAVLLMDPLFPGHDAVRVIRDLTTRHPKLRILVFSHHDENIHAERLLRAGAAGYLMKDAPRRELLKAVRQVAAGRVYVSPRLSVILLGRLLHPAAKRASVDGIGSLTDREFHVFQLLGAGLRARDVSARLGVSVKTVHAHRENIKNKLGLATAPELSRYASVWVSQHADARGELGQVPSRK